MTRLTNAFSKNIDGLDSAVALHFMHYNFCRVRQTLRVTPAMAVGSRTTFGASRQWSACLTQRPAQ